MTSPGQPESFLEADLIRGYYQRFIEGDEPALARVLLDHAKNLRSQGGLSRWTARGEARQPSSPLPALRARRTPSLRLEDKNVHRLTHGSH
jgi:hypothetical protein